MQTIPTARRFLHELRRWTGHCILNATPSFGIAILWFEMKTVESIAAMICAIITFILGYATLTSLNLPLSNREHPIGRALRIGLIVRAWISGISCLCIPLPPLMLLTPDPWSGFLAIQIVKWLHSTFLGLPFDLERSPANMSFGAVYLTTLLEGLILSGVLFGISFFALIIVQTMLRKRMIPSNWLIAPDDRRPSPSSNS